MKKGRILIWGINASVNIISDVGHGGGGGGGRYCDGNNFWNTRASGVRDDCGGIEIDHQFI